MNRATTEAKPIAISDAKARLAELEAEAVELKAKLAELSERRLRARSEVELSDDARRLIAGEDLESREIAPQIAEMTNRVTVNAKAQAILHDSIDLEFLRAKHAELAPLHAKAKAHIAAMGKALDALEAVQRAATTDVEAFRSENDQLHALRLRFPNEQPPYSDYDLVPLILWKQTLLGDGYNISKLGRWREDVRELGLI